jgi:ABC-type Zn uptake system ZnuABC Zn-binding protein ZnuA
MRIAILIIAVLSFLLVPYPAAATIDKVVATHLPLWCMVKSVAGEGWDVDILIRPGADVHSFSLRPGDLRAIRKSDVIFKSGAGLEAHLERGLQTASKVVDASAGIEPIRSGEGGLNPHVWLDPLLASRMVDNIAMYFKGDPAALKRAGKLKGELMAIHGEAERVLRPLKGRALVTYHDSFAYLARRYGLRAYSLTGPHGESPLPARMRGLYDMAGREEIIALFSETGYPDSTLRKTASDLGLKVCTLDTLTAGPMEAGYYIRGMRNNIETMARCLEGSMNEKQ